MQGNASKTDESFANARVYFETSKRTTLPVRVFLRKKMKQVILIVMNFEA